MHRLPISALILATAITVGAPPRASMARSADYCGAGYDRCMQTCDMSLWTGAPAPYPPGRCNDYCAQGTNICEAGRVPRPGHRMHHY